ncbi:thioredoxin-like protein [Vararia minispora EC-137]|uniref:Thioredoxin-like protein n=1 Tax=Vararia minispora EC-137 TaxID=1314806 RepID=A0ACB8QXI0_9AGAM|nr:thioredoxin-like protein [Vararia minispora EC-137]
MFSSFLRTLPEITLFHNKVSPPSVRALALLQSAVSSPYPPNGTSRAPLKFNLTVAENPPTPDQVRTILSYLRSSDVAVLLSAHPSVGDHRPTTPEALVRLVESTPNALKWPVVVDWSSGRATAGSTEGVLEILEYLRKVRDSKAKSDG